MAKEIPMANGHIAIVDDDDFSRVSQFKWQVNTYGYARRTMYNEARIRVDVKMHRFIAGVTDRSIEVDHRNGNKLDNRKENLRLCTHSQNMMNRGANRRNKSGFKGVVKKGDSWEARIAVNKIYKHLGRFPTAELASEAYKQAAIELHGEFANTQGKQND